MASDTTRYTNKVFMTDSLAAAEDHRQRCAGAEEEI